MPKLPFFRLAVMATLAVLSCTATAACGTSDSPDDEEADDSAAASSEQDLSGNSLKLGYAGGRLDSLKNPTWPDLFTTTKGSEHTRICHTYTSWDVTTHPGDASEPGSLAYFDAWHDQAAGKCEIMVTFKSTPRNGVAPTKEPTPGEFETAFKAFRLRYPSIHVFTTWNEANNGHESGDGLDHLIPPDTAARYYLALRRNCRPSLGCLVATPDLLGWYDANAFQMKCSKDPDVLCDHGSYLDQFKYHLKNDAAEYGFSDKFRPEYIALHPWNDAFRYTRDHSHCTDSATCVTKAALENLGGSWGKSLLWMTEVGVHSDKGDETQACGGAFLQRLFASSKRITRFYYFSFCHGVGDGDVSLATPGPGNSCTTGTANRAIMNVLRDRVQNHSNSCP